MHKRPGQHPLLAAFVPAYWNAYLKVFLLLGIGLHSLPLQSQYLIDYNGDWDPQFVIPLEVFLGPDELSTALPVGFNFTFFGNTYSQFYISSNGFITFDPDAGSGWGGQFIPDDNDPNDMIAAVWGIISPDDIFITYETMGSAPNRSLHVNFTLEKYSDPESCISGHLIECQVILREGSGKIEMHTQTWNGSNCFVNATQGLENEDGTLAFFVPGRNYEVWDVNEDYVAFIPGEIIDMSVLSYEPTVCTGMQDIQILAQNLSTITIDSLYFDWEWDGVPQNSVFINTPVPQNSYIQVTLGQKNIIGSTNYNLKAWSYNPDNEIDIDPVNDTIIGIVHAGLKGTFTIGGSTPNYATIAAAITDLEAKGVCDSVIFNIRNGVYNENLDLDYFASSGAGIAVFQSETGNAADVTITKVYNSGSSNHLIDINNCSNLKFRDLTCKVTGTACSNVFFATSYCSGIQITDCILQGSNCNSTTANGAVINMVSGQKDAVTISNNIIRKGSYGIHLLPGGSSYFHDLNITGNAIDSCYKYGLYMNRIDGMQLNRNHFFSAQSGVVGMDMFVLSGEISVSQNEIYVPAGWYGFKVYNYVSNSGTDSMMIINNMINLGGSIGTSRAFNLDYSDGVFIRHNNINTSSTVSTGIGLYLDFNANTELKNNIITNLGIGKAASMYVTTADYNDYYSVNPPLISSGANYNTLADWQAASSQDANSLQVNPLYVAMNNLHVSNGALNNTGTPLLPPVFKDFDDQFRNLTTPDIGADEFGFLANDLSPSQLIFSNGFSTGNHQVKIVVHNLGSNAVNTYTVDWSLNGAPLTPVPVSIPIAVSGSDTISLGNVNLLPGQTYTVKAFTHLPNGNADSAPANDTVKVGPLVPPMNGIYTVGGSSPDFASLQTAFAALQLGGMVDSVGFAMRNGFYHTPLSLTANSVYNCNKPVKIYSESGNPASVIIDNNNTVAPVVRLNNVSGIKFSNLTLEITASAFHNVVIVENGATCNTFSNCIMNGRITTQTTTAFAAALCNTNQGVNNDFIGCTINKGSYGLYTNGPSASTNTGVDITGNTFYNNYYMGMYAANSDKIKIKNNTSLSDQSHSASHHGIVAEECKNVLFSHNSVYNLFGGQAGLAIGECDGQSGDTSRIFNNYAYTNCSFSMQFGYSDNTNIYNNTFRNTNGGAATFYWSNGVKVKNNIFESLLNGPAIEYLHMGNNYSSANNCLYAPGADIGELENVRYHTMAQWQQLGLDLTSVNTDPYFISNTYHVRSAILDGRGKPVVPVIDDIEGNTRHISTPDIGADEFTLAALDAGITAINYPKMPFPSGTNPVYIRFYNNGSDTLHSLEVHWEVNGVTQPTMTWNGILPKAAVYDSLEIGTYDFESYHSYDITLWLSQPNGMTDAMHFNDTTEVLDLVPGLAGVYTIGGESPDFETIADATAALTQGGASDDVTFNIRDGIYADPLQLSGPTPGLVCGRQIIFQSESQDSTAVEINNLGFSLYPIYLDGVSGITLRHLTVKTLTNSFPNAVHFKNGSHCLTIENCRMEGRIAVNDVNAIIYSPGDLDSLTTIRYNRLTNGSTAIYLRGVTGAKSKPVIKNNFIDQVKTKGIYLFREYGTLVENNLIISPDYTSSFGIYLDECGGYNKVSGNDVHVYAGQYGVRISFCPSVTEVINNMIKVQSASTGFGLYTNNNDTINVYHNSISLNAATTTINNNAAFYSLSNTKLKLINNVIASFSTVGQAMRLLTPLPLNIDYNDYHSLSSVNRLGDVNGTIVTTLAQIQAATSKDQHSLTGNPVYVDNVNDLHTHLALLNGTGLNVGVGIDFDLASRSNPPDIGADEFDPLPSNDAGAFMFMGPMAPFASGSKNVVMALKNFGGNALTSVTIRWTVNGIEQTPFNWTGNLLSAKCDTVIIGAYNFQQLISYSITMWTQLPNGLADALPDNDATTTDSFYAALSGTYTVGGFAPDFNLVPDMLTVLNQGGIVGNVTFNFRPGIYQSTMEITDLPKSSYAHTVTFQSESGDSTDVVITQNVNNINLVDLDDAHQIRFKFMSFVNTKGHVFHIRNGSSRITLENNYLEGSEALVSTRSLVYSPSTNDDSITITSNRFHEGYYSIYLYGSAFEKNHIIQGNTFTGSVNTCIYGRSIEAFTISNNKLLTSSTSSSDVYVWNTIGKFTFSGNTVLSDNTDNAVYMHTVANVTANPSLFINNFISKTGTNIFDAVYIQNVSKINIDFNTIYNGMAHSSSAALYTTGLTTYNIRNNILYSIQGPAYRNASGTPAQHDYNAIFSLGSVQAVNNSINYTTLASYASATSSNSHSKAVDPLLYSITTPAVAQYQLNGAGLLIAGISTDISGTTRTNPPDIGAKEFTPLLHDLKIAKVISPVDGCGLGANTTVTIILVNQGSSNENNINLTMKYHGVNTNENTGVTSIPAGDSLSYTFTQHIDASAFTTESMILHLNFAADLDHHNDTLVHTFTNYPPFENPVGNMIPLNGTAGLENQVSLSWSPTQGAVKYDLYLWPSSGSKPLTPTTAGILTINKLVSSLTYGQQYFWQIHAINLCNDQYPSDTSSFTVRHLPDLIVQSMVIPPTAFSEQTISVEWIVKNQGLGATVPGTWYDNIYLSNDPTYNGFDPLLASVSNLSSLNPGMTYNHSASVVLPEGTNGLYYIIIKTDHYSGVKETNESNNTTFSTSQINVALSPPPDLIVTQITTPVLTFSGQMMSMTFKVKNIGSGLTTESIWKDDIDLLPAPSNNNGMSAQLLTKTHTGTLLPDSSYLVSISVMIPPNIFGDFQIRVTTDELNDVFEFATENNNSLLSNVIQVVLTPPADLIPQNLVIPGTISLYQTYPVTYQIKNQGGSAPTVGWSDRYYLSQSPVYNTNFLTYLGVIYHNAGLMPGNHNSKSVNLKLTDDYTGTYYLYIVTDYADAVNEYEFEGNNILRSNAIQIIRPDLRVGALQHAPSVLSGNLMPITTKIINNGPGYFNATLANRYYLSSDNVLNTMTDLLLTTKSLTNVVIDNGDTLTNVFSLQIPVQAAGAYYIICQTDATQVIFEGNENNNTLASPLTIFEAPHADLIASQLTVPAAITAGVPFDISYNLKNQGNVAMTLAETDSIFLSFSPAWIRNTATPLAARITSLLDTNQILSYTLSLGTLIDQNPNVYYIYIISDATQKIYEGSGEANNILRSNQLVLSGYPDIDIKAGQITGIPDTVTSGQVISIQYNVTNLSADATYYSSWTDRAYLSTDSVFQKPVDMSIGSLVYQNGKLNAGQTRTVTQNLNIPNGIQGDYYVFIEADEQDLNDDPVRANNVNTVRQSGVAHKIHIKLAHYPDLQPVNFVTPVSVIAGQYFDIRISCSNQGPGNAGIRADRIFVSNNNVIDQGDLVLSSITKSTLISTHTQLDTVSVFLPANYTGNYYLIYSVDHLDQVYEYNQEQNNILLSTVIVIPPPPADLYVKNILVPDSVLAGKTANISWQTSNKGLNPASGIFREILYLSPDTLWNITDEVIGIWDGQATLTPGGTVTKTLPFAYNNVTNADYHTIIRTDARNNFLESDENNNDGFSYDQTNVDIEEIFLELNKEDSLYANTLNYYKLHISADEAGLNILFQLTGDSLTGVNQMYVKYGAVPTPADHDYSYGEPFSPHQQIVVRDAVPGYYYVMVQGYKAGSVTPQPMDLLARIIRMEILDISPRKGSNTGFTTIEAIGSELDSIVLVRLVLDDTTYHEIIADTFIMTGDGTKVIARFNLKDQPLGHYHLQCLRESIYMASYRHGFEIIEGGGHEISVAWSINPQAYNPRFNNLLQVKIDIENTGDADAEGKQILVGTADFNNPVYYSLVDYYNGIIHSQLVLDAEDMVGFPGILRPGARRTYYVYGRINGTQGFAINYDN